MEGKEKIKKIYIHAYTWLELNKIIQVRHCVYRVIQGVLKNVIYGFFRKDWMIVSKTVLNFKISCAFTSFNKEISLTAKKVTGPVNICKTANSSQECVKRHVFFG